MFKHRSYIILLVLVFIAPAAGIPADSDRSLTPESTPGDGQILALLVGASKYPSLDSRLQLEGPVNDVELMRHVLTNRFGAKAKNICRLSDADDADAAPTFDNIEREIMRIAAQARRGDHVLIYLAGHGTQAPDSRSEPDEVDGLDELFLPRDVGVWNGRSGQVANAISDDRLGDWLTRIRHSGAFVLLVVDACHSGTVSRSDGPVARGVTGNALSIPAAHARIPPFDTPKQPEVSGLGEFVAIYATHPKERTFEQPLPSGGDVHGRFSWALGQVLLEEQLALNYREVARRLGWYYQQAGWQSARPLMLGTALNNQFLGSRDCRPCGRFRLTEGDKDTLQLDAGSLHGLTHGTVLAVFSEPGVLGTEPIGHVRIVSAGPLQSRVECVDGQSYASLDKSGIDLSLPATCSVVFRNLATVQKRVGIDVSQIENPQQQRDVLSQLSVALTIVADSAGSPARTAGTQRPDWILRASTDGRTTDLVPANGNRPLHAVSLRLPVDSRLPAQVNSVMTRVARASFLRRLAACPVITTAADTLRVRARAERIQSDGTGIELSPEEPVVRDGDHLQIVIRNLSVVPVDVTVLYVQSDYAIQCFYPSGLDFNRLRPGGVLPVSGIRINDSTLGWEDVIVLSVQSDNQPLPASFSFLAQPGINESSPHTVPRGAGPRLESPLAQLLRPGPNSGVHRGLPENEWRRFRLQRVSWHVVAN